MDIIKRYLNDAEYKTRVSLYLSLTANLLYAALNTVLSAVYHTAWFGILAGYYFILALMRFLMVRFIRRVGIGGNRLSELKRSRSCALILFTVNLSLSAVVLMMMYRDRGYEYHGVLIYVMAMYTFYAVGFSVADILRNRARWQPIMLTARTIDMTAALVSVLALETAMFSQFGQDMDISSQRLMIALTGAGISITVISVSVLLIIKYTKEIRNIKNGK